MVIQRGQRLKLEQLLDPEWPFVIGFSASMTDRTIDCCCFGLGADKRVNDESYVTYFNQPRTPCGGVSLAAPAKAIEGFEIDLRNLPLAITSLVLVATMGDDDTFSQMVSGSMEIIQKGCTVGIFALNGRMFSNERSIILVEFYRKDDTWRFNANGQGFEGGFAALADYFGVDTCDQSDSFQIPSPPLSLLPLDDLPPLAEDIAIRESTSRAIERILSEFKVRGTITGTEAGPIVTTYSLDPAPGVKVSRVTNLEPDIALALSTPGLRIDPIYTHGVIGIEIPNKEREIVPLRRILTAKMYKESSSPLLLPLGVDTRGNPVVNDLEPMPHLLIAGTTRSGKSVALHGILCSLLFRTSPSEVRLLLLDPKRNEFTHYDHVPHLLAPVVIQTNQAVVALQWMTVEMESRYQRMNGIGVRNLAGWRMKRAEHDQLGCSNALIPEVPPLLVVVVDELADLMLQSDKAVEGSLVRLAQMGRAAGIHLVLATQRPSRDVLTGLIKSNIPARLSFKVTSAMDSRIILDTGGAENLLGRGDGLFIAPGQSIQRIQAPMVTEENVTALVRFITNTRSSIPDPSLMAALQV